MLYSKCRCLLPAARAHKSVMEWPQRIGPEVSAGQQSAAPQQRALVKVPSAVYVSAGTVNHGPGIYNTSLPSHHKTLMFINVNAPDLYLNVIYMSQLKGVLMRGDAEGRRGGGRDLRTDGQTEMSDERNEKWISCDDFYTSRLFVLHFVLGNLSGKLLVPCGVSAIN